MGVGHGQRDDHGQCADSPLIDTARIDIGHTMTDLEVHNLPLVARNPYNFALVQPGVTGYRERRVRRAAPGGQRRRDAHQLPDRRQHEHREGPRGPAASADVGSDDSGSEGRDHRVSRRSSVRRWAWCTTPSRRRARTRSRARPAICSAANAFSAFPFFFGCGSTTPAANCPAASGQRRAARDESGYGHGGRRRADPEEQAVLLRRLGADAPRSVVGQPGYGHPSIVAQLGLKPQPDAVRRTSRPAKFASAKSDYQVNNDKPRDRRAGCGSTTTRRTTAAAATRRIERATDFLDAMDSVAGQLVSTIGSSTIERVPRSSIAHRHQSSVAQQPIRGPVRR